MNLESLFKTANMRNARFITRNHGDVGAAPIEVIQRTDTPVTIVRICARGVERYHKVSEATFSRLVKLHNTTIMQHPHAYAAALRLIFDRELASIQAQPSGAV